MRLIIAIGIVLLLYSIQSRLYRKYWKRGLDVTLSFSRDTADIGEELSLTEVITNRKSLPLPILHVKFYTARSFLFSDNQNAQTTDHYYRNDVFSILGNQKITRQLTFQTTHRGYFAIDSLQITSKDLFLMRTFATSLENRTYLYVLPAIIHGTAFDTVKDKILGDMHANGQGPEDPYAFCGIRAYQTYDSMKHINWKATAHTGTLMVNQYQPAISDEVCILLNMTPYSKSGADALQEHAINIAHSLGLAFMEHAIDVSLYTNGCDILSKAQPCLMRGHGTEHQMSLSRLLSRLDIRQKCTSFTEMMRTHLQDGSHRIRYIIISTYRDDALLSIFESICPRTDAYWIIPEYPSADIRYDNRNIIKWSLI